MSNILSGIFSIILGLVFAIFHKQFAHYTVSFYYKQLHVQFNEKWYRFGFLIGGLFGIIFGILDLLGIIKFRQ